MKIYNYDSITKEYIGESEASLDIEATKAEGHNVYYLPACATFTKPPKTVQYEIAVYNNGWTILADYRGCWIVDDNMQPKKVEVIGDLPEGFIVVTDAQCTKIVENPDFYVIDDGVLVPNPNYEQIKYQEHVNVLTEAMYQLKAQKAYGGVVVNDLYIFETNQISITNTVASLALMGTKTNWKFYNLEGFPVAIELTKAKLTTIAKFGQKMMEDCFKVEGLANAQIAQESIENINNAQWRNDFIASVKAQMDAVNNHIEMEL